MQDWTSLYGLLFVTSLATAVALTWLWVKAASKLQLLDRPALAKFHAQPTPVGGGIAIFVAFTTILVFEPMRTPIAIILVGAGAVLTAIGLWDDLKSVTATTKFVALVALTTLLSQFGIRAHTTGMVVVDLLLTVLWVTGVSSAFNAIDNMDGLSTGVTAIASASFLIVAWQTQQWVFGGLCVGLLGASLGFLFFNAPPARVFMGDAGSFFLGFTLASLGMTGDWSANQVIAAVIPILVLGLPIFDLSFTVVTRHMNGTTSTLRQALSHCDTDHTSHRLVRLGLTPARAVLVLYLIAASFGLSAISLQNAAPGVALLHLCQALVVAGALTAILIGAPELALKRVPATPPFRAGWLVPVGMVVSVLATLWVMSLNQSS